MKLPRFVDVCSTRYRVRRATAKQCRELVDAIGICKPLAAEITIARGLSPEVEKTTFEHEVAHAAMEESGAKYLMAHFVESESHLDELEEILVRTWLPAYVAALKGVRR